MADALTAVHEVRGVVAGHFERSADPLNVEQIVEMTALDEEVVGNALAVLYNKGEIEGITVLEVKHPLIITNYRPA